MRFYNVLFVYMVVGLCFLFFLSLIGLLAIGWILQLLFAFDYDY